MTGGGGVQQRSRFLRCPSLFKRIPGTSWRIRRSGEKHIFGVVAVAPLKCGGNNTCWLRYAGGKKWGATVIGSLGSSGRAAVQIDGWMGRVVGRQWRGYRVNEEGEISLRVSQLRRAVWQHQSHTGGSLRLDAHDWLLPSPLYLKPHSIKKEETFKVCADFGGLVKQSQPCNYPTLILLNLFFKR